MVPAKKTMFCSDAMNYANLYINFSFVERYKFVTDTHRFQFNFLTRLFPSLLHGSVIKELSENEHRKNMSEQSGQTEQSGTQNQSTAMERMKKKQVQKSQIYQTKETDLTKTNPRMWWEQISEYIDLTYHKN